LKDLVELPAHKKKSVKFTEIRQLPDPDTCFDCVTLSTSTRDCKEFCKEFDCVVSMQCEGMGEVRSSPWLNDNHSSDLDNCDSFALCKKKITVETSYNFFYYGPLQPFSMYIFYVF